MAERPKSLWTSSNELADQERPVSVFDGLGWRGFADLYRVLNQVGIPPTLADEMSLDQIIAVLHIDILETDGVGGSVAERMAREGGTLAARAAAIRHSDETPDDPESTDPVDLTAQVMREMGITPPPSAGR